MNLRPVSSLGPRPWWAWLLVGLLWLGMVASAHSGALKLSPEVHGPQELAGVTDVYLDDTGKRFLDDVRSPAIDAQFRHRSLALGFVHGAAWLRLKIDVPVGLERGWWIQISPPYLDHVTFHHLRPDGQWREHAQGDRVPTENPLHRDASMAVDLGPGLHTFYIRVQGTSAITVLPRLVPQSIAIPTWQKEYLIYGLYIGLELALLIAAVLGAVILRHRIYFLFAVFIGAGVVQRVAYSNLVNQWWLNTMPQVGDAIAAASFGFNTAASALFFAALFDYRKDYPRLYWLSITSAVFLLISAVTGLFDPANRLAEGRLVVTVFVHLMLFIPLWRQWKTGELLTRLAVVGFLIYIFSALLHLFTLLGLAPLIVGSLQSSQWGSLLLMFMLQISVLQQTLKAQQAQQKAEAAASQAQIQAERERRAREEQGHLTAMLAHEIRTPVAVIDASLQSLRILDEHPTSERQVRHDRIDRAVQRMNTLMELVVTQDRLAVSEWTQRLANVNLTALTIELVSSLGPGASERVRLDFDDRPREVRADERMLQFALINLLDNALKYSPRHTEVSISIVPMERQGLAGYAWRVDDHGTGITEADRERVFLKYFRAAETSGSPGLGIGLHIVRQIADRHHGEVLAMAGPDGIGTRFQCWLPREQKEIQP